VIGARRPPRRIQSDSPQKEQELNANDARVTQLFVAVDGSLTQDDSPNETGGVAGDKYDLLLRAEAGSALGDSEGDYTLAITAYNVSKGVAEPGLNPFTNPKAEEFDAANNWKPLGVDFVKQEKYDITIPNTVPRGDVFQYTAQLISDNFEVISIIQSDRFALV
jgi:hypothetical protein